MENRFDIFISYKQKSLPTANNLYYRLTKRGYSVFFDHEEMRRDNFNTQLLNYIENAKDIFVILEEGSLDACNGDNWKDDWFCHEISHALEKKKNIIPILLNGYQMPKEDSLPDELKELCLKHSPDFSFSYFDAYLDRLIEKKFITSEAHVDLYEIIVQEGRRIISLRRKIKENVKNAKEKYSTNESNIHNVIKTIRRDIKGDAYKKR